MKKYSDTVVWFDDDSPSCVPWQDNFGLAWDLFIAQGVMLEHETVEF